MINLTAVILTKDEEDNIREAIENLSFSDEVLVIDDFSTDKTTEIAKNLGARVTKRKLRKNFSDQRNFALKKAKGKWVLFLDADERVSPNLKDEIIQAVNSSLLGKSGFLIRREDILWGKALKGGEFAQTWLLRLAKKDSGVWTRSVHETWQVEGTLGKLRYPITHSPHSNLKEFISEVNKMSSLHTKANQLEGKRSTILKIILFPKLKFIKNYIILGGFKDGMRGFAAALIMSLHSFLAWSNLLLIQKQESKN